MNRHEYIKQCKTPKGKHSTVLNIRISLADHAKAKKAAKAQSLTVSQWARSRLFYD